MNAFWNVAAGGKNLVNRLVRLAADFIYKISDFPFFCIS
jgi:hypothetical protein